MPTSNELWEQNWNEAQNSVDTPHRNTGDESVKETSATAVETSNEQVADEGTETEETTETPQEPTDYEKDLQEKINYHRTRQQLQTKYKDNPELLAELEAVLDLGAKETRDAFLRNSNELAADKQRVAEWIALQELAQTDPLAAKRHLEEQVQRLSQYIPQQQPEPDYSSIDYNLDMGQNVRETVQQLARMEAERLMAPYVQQMEHQKLKTMVSELDTVADQFGKDYGLQIGEDQKAIALKAYKEQGLKPEQAYWLIFQKQIQTSLVNKGRAEGSKALAKRGNAPAPPSAVTTVNEAPTNEMATWDDFYNDVVSQRKGK